MTVVRPAIIMGPGDDTERFTYWPVRVARGGEMIAPGDGSDHVQLIDVRDLVEFNIRLVENRTFGVFNALGPQMGQPFSELLDRVQRGGGGNARFAWVDPDFLKAGLSFRPTEVTAKDTLDWFRTVPANRQANMLKGLQREAQVLAAWKARKGRGVRLSFVVCLSSPCSLEAPWLHRHRRQPGSSVGSWTRPPENRSPAPG